MQILVTGASGFMGTALCRHLEQRGHILTRVDSKVCDLTINGSLAIFNGNRFDEIYHLAAWTQAGDFCLHHAGEQWIINQQINTNVLAWWQRYQPQAKLIAMGTSCAYAPGHDLVEAKYLDGIPIDSLFTYAMTKRMLYVGLKALHKQYDLQYLYIVPSTLYGPDYHTDGRQMHFIFDLIRKILRGKKFGEPVVLWGNGHQKRELVYVDDFIDILLKLNSTCVNDIVNIGAGQEYSIRDFAQSICNICNYEFYRIQFDETQYVGATSKVLSVEKMQGLVSEYHVTTLDEGLGNTISWFEDRLL
jgi:GDP-L-fucose synthase